MERYRSPVSGRRAFKHSDRIVWSSWFIFRGNGEIGDVHGCFVDVREDPDRGAAGFIASEFGENAVFKIDTIFSVGGTDVESDCIITSFFLVVGELVV